METWYSTILLRMTSFFQVNLKMLSELLHEVLLASLNESTSNMRQKTQTHSWVDGHNTYSRSRVQAMDDFRITFCSLLVRSKRLQHPFLQLTSCLLFRVDANRLAIQISYAVALHLAHTKLLLMRFTSKSGLEGELASLASCSLPLSESSLSSAMKPPRSEPSSSSMSAECSFDYWQETLEWSILVRISIVNCFMTAYCMSNSSYRFSYKQGSHPLLVVSQQVFCLSAIVQW